MSLDMASLTLAPCLTIWGARVLYERPGQPAFVVRGLFDRAALSFDMPEGLPVSTTRVQIGVALADFPAGFAPQQDDRLQVAMLGTRQIDASAPLPSGATIEAFDVRDVQRDGEGGALLILSGRIGGDP